MFGDSAVVNPPQPELSPLGPVLELAVGLADQLDNPWRYPSTSMPWIARNDARYWRCSSSDAALLHGKVQPSPFRSVLAGQLTAGDRIGALVGVVTPVELLEIFSEMQRSSCCDPYALL